MAEGWILDAYPDRMSDRMTVWVKHSDGSATRHLLDWSATVHVYSSDEKHMELVKSWERNDAS